MAGLAYVQDGQAILAVDSKNDLPLGANRDSYVVPKLLQVSSFTCIF